MANPSTGVRGRHTASRAMGQLGTLIRKRRDEAGLSLRALGEKAGVGFNTVREIEIGLIERPTRETLEGLSRALGLAIETLARAV